MVRVGLVGCGAAGKNHLASLAQAEGAELAAVTDLREDFAREAGQEYGVPYYTDLADMLEAEPMDGLSVVTSMDSHYVLVKMALERGFHVMSEKPLTLEPDQSAELALLADRTGKILAVTYTYHFVPDTARVKEIIDSGVIGRVLEARFVNLHGSLDKLPEGSEERRRYDFFRDGGKGILYDCGTHGFDLLRWYVGSEVKQIHTFGAFHEGYQHPDSATVVFEYENGVKGIYDVGPFPYYDNGTPCGNFFYIAVTGDQGAITWEFGTPDSEGALKTRVTTHTKTGKREEWFRIYGKHRKEQYEAFAASIQAGRLLPPFPSPHDCAAADRISSEVVAQAAANAFRPC
jgi:UDP-N-acetyl-2-amino-2-deoxyglucuronate dehydrogenase